MNVSWLRFDVVSCGMTTLRYPQFSVERLFIKVETQHLSRSNRKSLSPFKYLHVACLARVSLAKRERYMSHVFQFYF